MGKLWCMMDPGSKALIGVPTGPDAVEFNSCRIYSRTMYPHLFANWRQVYTETHFRHYNTNGCTYCYQPLHVLERI